MSGKCLLGQDDGMNIFWTLRLYLAPELALVSGDVVRSTRDTPPNSVPLPRSEACGPLRTLALPLTNPGRAALF